MTTAFELGYTLGLRKQAGAAKEEHKPIVVPKPKIVLPKKKEVVVEPAGDSLLAHNLKNLQRAAAEQNERSKQYEISGPTAEQRRYLNTLKGKERKIVRWEQFGGINRLESGIK